MPDDAAMSEPLDVPESSPHEHPPEPLDLPESSPHEHPPEPLDLPESPPHEHPPEPLDLPESPPHEHPSEPLDLPELSPHLHALREHVLEHSVKRGEFTLKSGARSSWFLDTKQTACRPDGILLVADAMLDVIPDDATAIGGLTMGADPVAFGVAAVAATRGRMLRSFSVRKEAKGHGVTGRLAGALLPGDRVVVTEDTTTRGTSLMEAVDIVREFGAVPVLVSLIVDRGDTCAAMCAAAGVPYAPLLTAPDLGFPPGS